MRRSRISEIFIREGLKWRHDETWFGERVDPDFAKKTKVAKPAVGRRAVRGRRGRRQGSGGSGTLAWWRCFKRARVSRHLARSTAARSWALIGARRVNVAAGKGARPTTLCGGTLRPGVRRAWW